MTCEIRIRSKNVDELLALVEKLSETLKVAHSEPRFNESYGDFTCYFTIAGGEK